MLTKGQGRLIRELATKKTARKERGMLLVEGEKFVRDAARWVEFSFTDKDLPDFHEILTTDNPQHIAAVARTPVFSWEDVQQRPIIVLLDGVQDPANVGAVMRSCFAFGAGLILCQAADPTNPKTVRASAGTLFQVPWIVLSPEEVEERVRAAKIPVARLERRRESIAPEDVPTGRVVLIAGNEGKGIRSTLRGPSVAIAHESAIDSLNVGVAVGIVLYALARR